MRHALDHRGFTLVEVLVTLLIISVLIGLGAVGLAGARDSARSTRCLSNLRQLAQATIQYADQWQGFPTMEKVARSDTGPMTMARLMGIWEPGAPLPDLFRCPADRNTLFESPHVSSYAFVPTEFANAPGTPIFEMPRPEEIALQPRDALRWWEDSGPDALPLWWDYQPYHLSRREFDRYRETGRVSRPNSGRNGGFFDGSARRL